jgi:5-hydroxyisourate hydrolase-like protein (transthyretin family)
MFLALLWALWQSPLAAPSSVIRGHVYNMATGEPIAGAAVSMRWAPFTEQSTATTTTDAQGAFVFRGLSRQRYFVTCAKDGFASDDEAYPLLSDRVLNDREEKTGVDCHVWRAAVVTGTVTDADNEPISGVTVQAIRKDYWRASLTLMAAAGPAETDDHGHFRIFGLIPGSYYLKADRGKQNTKQRGYAPAFYPNASTWTDAQALRISAGQEYSGFHLTIHEAATFEASGKIVDAETGRPAGGAIVRVSGECSLMLPADSIETNADGTFHFSALTSGRYWMRVHLAGSRPRAAADVPFEIAGSNVKDLVIRVGAETRLSGKIRADEDLQRQLQASGVELWANVRSRDPAGDGMSAGGQLEDGAFTFEGLPAGTYDLSFEVPDPAGNLFVSQILANDRDITDRGVVIAPGDSVLDVLAILSAGAGNVTGKVLDSRDRPAARMHVVLVSADPKKRQVDRYFKSSKTDSSGAFKIPNIVPGEYLMVPWPLNPGDVLDPDIFARIQEHATSVRVESSATVNKDLRMTPEIRAIAGLAESPRRPEE